MIFDKRFLYHIHYLGVHDSRSDEEVIADIGYRPYTRNVEWWKKQKLKPEALK